MSIVPFHHGTLAPLTESVIGKTGAFYRTGTTSAGVQLENRYRTAHLGHRTGSDRGHLGTLYGADPATQSVGLQAALRHDMTIGGAIALVVFFAFAMQCTSTLAVVRRETNSWKWPAVQFFYMTGLAYMAALATNICHRISICFCTGESDENFCSKGAAILAFAREIRTKSG